MEMKENRWREMCWRKKQKEEWCDLYEKEREKYYNRNGQGIKAIDNINAKRDMIRELRGRDRDVQSREGENKRDKI